MLAAAGCDSKSRGERQTPSSADEDKVAAAADVASAKTNEAAAKAKAEAPKASDLARYTADIQGSGALTATIETTLGVVKCELYEKQAPVTVANFVGLATGKKTWVDPQTGELRQNAPYYDGVEFHRVIPNFLIQAGDRTATGSSGPGYTLPDEFHPELRHDEAGVLSMANKGKPDSAGSQWFITEAPIPHLDNRHSVFGQCEDLDVVKKIARVPTGPQNRPKDPPKIESISFSRELTEAATN
ncbi:peptidylprolyl isomerase [Persicimonas caeni]|uniref:Peptidyl-prolyl cis-trans isomerase n=2 Tax=Persicimonas caeni TaxID=2292766 RepID=A0A4Y6Q342_PERCE|nr:peptidylprolyl isomerase [Persicimonas caeni]QED36205.1 peptidylprolyl isomerase [Persicimonas caeni]